jgi:hypothetical protein
MKRFVALLLAVISVPVFAADVGVRIRFGLTDDGNTVWDGSVSVSPGTIERIDGWRFEQTDAVLGGPGAAQTTAGDRPNPAGTAATTDDVTRLPSVKVVAEGANSWKASTRPITVRRGNNAKKKAKGKAKGGGGLMADNGVFVMLHDVNDNSVVKVKTKQGDFDFQIADVPYGKVVEKLNGAIDIERVASTKPLSSKRDDDDYPAIAVAANGNVSAAWISFTPGLDRDERARRLDRAPADFSYLAKEPGGDRIWVREQRNGTWGEPIAVTSGGGDIYKCAIASDGSGKTWVFWAENTSWPKTALANFEIFATTIQDGKVGAQTKLSDAPGSDVSPVAATDASGRVWVAWQGARDNVFRIVERHQAANGSWSAERIVSTQTRNCWVPAIAAAKNGRVAIAWDTYEKGDYDVWMREFNSDGTAQEARPVANSPEYEARASVAYDGESRLWIAWERSGATWGKNWGALDHRGIGLYQGRQIGMLVLADGKWMEPAQPPSVALPGANPRRGPRNLPVRRPEPEATTRKAGQESEVSATAYNNMARLACDRDGRIWLFARSREGTFHTPLGTVWCNYAASYDGSKWTGPTILPHSDNLLYNTPAVAAHPGGGFVVAHSSDHRQDRHIERAGGGNDALSAGKDPYDNDVYISRLEMPASTVKLQLVAAKQVPSNSVAPTPDTVAEREAIDRSRTYRSNVDGKSLQIIRGEFHRHTEISGDAANDGPLEDMWRYAIDVAGMDWLGNGDHDNGAGREYTWWLTQKTTDAFRLPGRFDPPFTYERSVAYPEGHRNVVLAQRGVRTLPRLPKTNPEPVVSAPDTEMLYKYLRYFNGVCASHTSATDMGTDWRNNAPDVEPMVEIYQGCRQSYERPGAPRSPTENDAIGGWRPRGFVNLALQKGYRFSFESSSDHTSTHISYAMVYAEDTSREALLRAMRLRHTYAATDNIIAEYRCNAGGRDYLLGDEFTTNEPPTLRLKLHGTAPFSKVTLVKDDEEVHVITPNKDVVELTWKDPKPTPGKTSYYYFRGEQANDEMVWVSPMWITYNGK